MTTFEDKLDEAIRGIENKLEEKTTVKERGFYEEYAKTQDITNLKRPVYVIHEHHSSRLHWDLRFEDGGVMRTWRLYKSPPQTGNKILAQLSRPIPIGAALFEGVIKQEYGGGKMKIWDSGTFDLVEKKGKKFVVNIKGKELKGKYSLVRFQPSDIPRLDKWLFFKI